MALSRPDPLLLVLLHRSQHGIGGEEKRFSRLWAHLHQSGLAEQEDMYLITNAEHFREMIDAGIPLVEDSRVILLSGWKTRNRLERTLVISRLFAILRRHFPCTIHLVSEGVIIAPLLLPFKMTQLCRIIVTFPTYSLKRLRRSSPRTYWAYRVALQMADRIDTLNRLTDLADFVPKSKIRTSPCSFSDPVRYRPCRKERGLVSFVGHLTHDKGALLFAEAVSLARQMTEDLKVAVVGSGPQEAQVREILEHRGVPLVWFGHSFRPEEVLCRSEVFCSLQLQENYPSQSLLEAMLTENVIIATDVGETRRLVDDSVGWLVPANPVAVANAITSSLSMPREVLRSMGAQARARVVKEHTVERFWAYLESVYREVR